MGKDWELLVLLFLLRSITLFLYMLIQFFYWRSKPVLPHLCSNIILQLAWVCRILNSSLLLSYKFLQSFGLMNLLKAKQFWAMALMKVLIFYWLADFFTLSPPSACSGLAPVRPVMAQIWEMICLLMRWLNINCSLLDLGRFCLLPSSEQWQHWYSLLGRQFLQFIQNSSTYSKEDFRALEWAPLLVSKPQDSRIYSFFCEIVGLWKTRWEQIMWNFIEVCICSIVIRTLSDWASWPIQLFCPKWTRNTLTSPSSLTPPRLICAPHIQSSMMSCRFSNSEISSSSVKKNS